MAVTYGTTGYSLTENIQTALKYSIRITIAFVLIFVLAKILGLAQFTELRFINYIIIYPIAYTAVKQVYLGHQHRIEYFNGLSIAFLTCFLGQLWYAVLFFLYLQIDKPFLDYLVTQLPGKFNLYPGLSSAFILITEGAGLSAIISLTLMQYFKWKRGRWNSHA